MDFTALLPFATRRRDTLPAARRARAGFRPALDALEGRLVLSHAGGMVAALHHAPAHVQPLARTANQQISLPINISDINITQVTRDATTGALNLVGTVTGTILGKTFTTDLTGTITPAKNAKNCPVLDLHLAPINLSLLGLNVNTSQICLNINAQKNGGLLGNLLCGGLSDVLTSATSGTTDALNTATTQVNTLFDNSQVINGLNRVLSSPKAKVANFAAAQGSTCPVLDLAVGPVRLNLLGLKVRLDNCANGPVTVNVSATQGGGLLGNLVCGLTGNPTGRALTQQVNSLLQNITNTAGGVV